MCATAREPGSGNDGYLLCLARRPPRAGKLIGGGRGRAVGNDRMSVRAADLAMDCAMWLAQSWLICAVAPAQMTRLPTRP
jgi:hypothetical protein